MRPLRSLLKYEIIIAKYVCHIFLNMDWDIVGKLTVPKYNNNNELIIKKQDDSDLFWLQSCTEENNWTFIH